MLGPLFLEHERNLLRVDGFDQVVVETGILRETAILFSTPTGDSNQPRLRCR
jgi:hypothetical protein